MALRNIQCSNPKQTFILTYKTSQTRTTVFKIHLYIYYFCKETKSNVKQERTLFFYSNYYFLIMFNC